MAADRENVNIQIRITDRPLSLGNEARRNVPFPCPRAIVAYLELPTRAASRRARADLRETLSGWHVRGSWYRVPRAERSRFNAAWREALRVHVGERVMHWRKIEV